MNAPLTPESVMAALREVKVPGTRVDVVAINLIGEIVVTGGKVTVTVVRTSEKEETIAQVRQDVAKAVSAMPGVLSVEVPVDDRTPPKQAPRGPHGQSPDPFADRAKLPGVRKGSARWAKSTSRRRVWRGSITSSWSRQRPA